MITHSLLVLSVCVRLAFFLLRIYFLLLFFKKETTLFASANSERCWDIMFIIAYLPSFLPTSMHACPESHREVLGDGGKLHSPFLMNKRPQSTYYSLLCLCSWSPKCGSKDNWSFVVRKSTASKQFGWLNFCLPADVWIFFQTSITNKNLYIAKLSQRIPRPNS